jgi:pyruvate/2-oxoglutarate dehydrogenase complex dihydrolipoamide dehydrogenase (E3) component/uncharacterized membrane protein YdjX (TVP38/TMEM64 family)
VPSPTQTRDSKTWLRILAALTAVALIAAFFALGLQKYFTLSALSASRDALAQYLETNRFTFTLAFMGVYIAATALSLPGAAILTLAAGALFGFTVGTIVASISSTIGATLAFILARFILRDAIMRRYGTRLAAVDAGFKRDGAVYLLSLRLIPAVPFFLVNILMGLTGIRALTFLAVSWIGMLPGTMVYIYAGTQLATLKSMGDILSPGLLAALVLLGVFPLIARFIYGWIQSRRALAKYDRPKHYDYNMVVIGAGSAGLIASYVAAAVKAKVALIEKSEMGGDCLNTGCVPSKALIRSTRILSYGRRAEEFGFKSLSVDFTFADIMERVQRVIREIAPHDSPERYTGLGVECIAGTAHIVDPYRVAVNGRTLKTRAIIVATGAAPIIPPIPGLADVASVTSETLWNLRTLPPRLLVLGGGPIGCELAQCFARLGSKVTIVDMAPRILTKEDPDIAALVADRFQNEGITILTGHKAKAFTKRADGAVLTCTADDGGDVDVPFDTVLLALGRRARVTGFGLEELGVRIADNGTVETDPYLRTNIPNIYVCGDVAGPYQFTHVASHQAWYASVNAMFSRFYKVRADYRVIPWTTFTDPEVARVGLSEDEAKARNIPHEVTRYDLADLDRAIADQENYGVVKVLTPPGRDTILGVTIVGPDAGDLIAEFVLAMKHGLGLSKILGTIHIYPTLAEANKAAAGAWRKAHVPARAVALAERFHRWERG